jgi:DNA-directed RNA polymerase subunit RPC12/RpoP
VEVSDHDHIYHQSHFRCNRCNRPLVETQVTMTEVFRCPKCLHETLKFNGSDICWD